MHEQKMDRPPWTKNGSFGGSAIELLLMLILLFFCACQVSSASGEPVLTKKLVVPTMRVDVDLPLLSFINFGMLDGLAPACAHIAANSSLIFDDGTADHLCEVKSASASSVVCECKSAYSDEFRGSVLAAFRVSACSALSNSCGECTANPVCGWCGSTSTCFEGSATEVTTHTRPIPRTCLTDWIDVMQLTHGSFSGVLPGQLQRHAAVAEGHLPLPGRPVRRCRE